MDNTLNRRTFLSWLAAGAAGSRVAFAQAAVARKLALYANVGPVLTRYDVDVEAAELFARE